MAVTARRDVFQAIADPTRRQIIDLVARGPMNLNAIAENFDMARPSVSQHVKILAECGIVVIRQQGRERLCEAKLEKLKEVSGWIDTYRQFWETQFDSLEKYISKVQAKNKPKKKSK